MASRNSFMNRWMKKATPAASRAAPNPSDLTPLSASTRSNNLHSRRVSASFESEIETTPTLKRSAPSEIVELDTFSSKRAKKGSAFDADVDVDALDFLQGVETPPKAQKQRKVRRVVEYSDEEEEEGDTNMDDKASSPLMMSSLRKDSKRAKDEDVEMGEQGFPFSHFTHSKDAKPVDIPHHLQDQQSKARKLLKNKAMSGPKDDTLESDWAVKNSWAVDIRDRNGKRPGEDGYDKSSLYVPASALRKGSTLTPFQIQFWEIKKDNYDVIIFFKKGKFYEIYDVDADICHKLLGLTWTKNMRGDMRFCGVPEMNFDKFAARLLVHGYKIGRVEQTQTAIGKSLDTSKSKVCKRSLVKILTKSTVTSDKLLKSDQARYVLSIIEAELDTTSANSVNDGDVQDASLPVVNVAVCYVDASTGSVTVREFQDDFRRTETERLLTNIRPLEIIIDPNQLTDRVDRIVRWLASRTGADIVEHLPKAFAPANDGEVSQFLDPVSSEAAYNHLCRYLVQRKLGSCAFNAMLQYLKSLKIHDEILSMGNYDLQPPVGNGVAKVVQAVESSGMRFDAPIPTVRMDAATLNCLELVANTEDSTAKNTLFSYINNASTASGKRLLRQWVAAPLVRSEDINCRLDAVDTFLELERNMGPSDFSALTNGLNTKCDIERSLARLHKQATKKDTAVMYADVNVKNVQFFFKTLGAIEATIEAVKKIGREVNQVECKSRRLKWLVEEAIPSNALEKLAYFNSDAFDTSRAKSDGIIIPSRGAAPDYDQKKDALDGNLDELDLFLKKWKRVLGDKSLKFFGRFKETYQLEVPVATLKKKRMPNEFQLVSQTKTVKRFYTPESRRLVYENKVAEEAFEAAKKNVLREIVQKFDADYEIWSAIAKTCAELDALLGLTRTSLGDGCGDMCRPNIVPNESPEPVFKATALRHPVLAQNADHFVANDIELGGGDKPKIAVLTGPNAGGKSTLSRQVAVCALLAQIGCYVPGTAFTLRPFEDIFVRMGASDDIARGLSTFMVEMEDVSNILNNATSRSFVIADEVGRGTSTHDGYAIAYATLAHLVKESKCMGVFSTHYHMLGRDIAAECTTEAERKSVGVYQMAADMDEARKQITFLYKFQQGISTRSRGICCARLAGIPAHVADAAEKASARFEKNMADKLDIAAIKALVQGGDDDESLARVLDSMKSE